MTMAKKFWERKEFKIEQFASIFRQVYDLYYDAPYTETDEHAMMLEGDALMRDLANAPLLKLYADYMGDLFTSDREVAAFAVTYSIYQQRYT